MKKFFIGIDFSKKTIDVSIVSKEKPGSAIAYKKFSNSEEGAQAMLDWACCKTRVGSNASDDIMFCGEHTGTYCTVVADFLSDKGYYLWLGNPLDIKRSMGLVRGKDDKVDSLRIATYAATMEYKARLYVRPSDASRVLRQLLNLRNQLVENRKKYQVIKSECPLNIKDVELKQMVDSMQDTMIAVVNDQIAQVERKIQELIHSFEDMCKTFLILTSMKGIGLINASAIMCMTDCFKKFNYNSRQIAAYWGVVPYRNESGTSIRKGTHTSSMCHGWLRAILTEASLSAIRHNSKMREYYEHLLKAGKHKSIALNNVKNKMLKTLVAMVRDGKNFDANFKPKQPKAKCA